MLRQPYTTAVLFGCSAALSLPAHLIAADPGTNTVPVRTPRFQLRTTNTPPASPETFSPDPNPVRLPPVFYPDVRWVRPVVVSSNPPPNPSFNPDPGASIKTPTNAPRLNLFREPDLPARFSPPTIPAPLELPRDKVQLRLLGVTRDAYSFDPNFDELPSDQKLPRTNTSREMRIPTNFRAPDYASTNNISLPENSVARRDRWRIGFTPWKRYTSGVIEQPFESPDPMLWHPYKQSLLKGDVPVIGQDIFLDFTASSETVTELKRIPFASGTSTATPGEYEFYGQSDAISVVNNFGFSFVLFQGETVFRPVDWLIKVEPVFNVNYLQTRESGLVSPDPRGSIGGNNNAPPPSNGFVYNPGDIGTLLNGQTGNANSYRDTKATQRTKSYFSLQQAFLEVHLADLSDTYDFMSLRVGNQPFNADFRGFVFNDVNLGARLFGNYHNNLYQYNLALFSMREKETDSELNTLDSRDQEVFVANLFRQDLLWPGYTGELSFLANFDHGGTHYDGNGGLVRPELLGTLREHSVNAYYLGWGGDGHIGRFNVSHQFYQVFGHDEFNGLAGGPADINAQMAAMEISYDHDWARYKFSFFYASGDDNASDGHARGFDTIMDNPNFTGGPFSFWTRQGFNLGGTLINLKNGSSLVPDFRSSKSEGQANFVNPGIFILGPGLELDVTPKLRTFFNLNYIFFAETDPLKSALQVNKMDSEVGWDLSVGFQYRPLLTDNIILSTGFGALLPGAGYRDIYRTSTQPVPGFDRTDNAGSADSILFSGLIALTFTY